MVALSPPLKAAVGLNGRRVAEQVFLLASEGVSADVVDDIRKATQQAKLGINQWGFNVVTFYLIYNFRLKSGAERRLLEI